MKESQSRYEYAPLHQKSLPTDLQNVITSSVQAFQAQTTLGTMNYTSQMWANRTLNNYNSIEDGLPNPAWEGVFTIPVSFRLAIREATNTDLVGL